MGASYPPLYPAASQTPPPCRLGDIVVVERHRWSVVPWLPKARTQRSTNRTQRSPIFKFPVCREERMMHSDPERSRHVIKNRDEVFAFLRCWRVVRLTKTSTFGGPWDLILELILYLWTSFGQPFGGLDAHLGPFLAPWRSRVPKLMNLDPPRAPPGVPFWTHFGYPDAKDASKT